MAAEFASFVQLQKSEFQNYYLKSMIHLKVADRYRFPYPKIYKIQ